MTDKQFAMPTNGGTTSMKFSFPNLRMTPAAGIATQTVNLPPIPSSPFIYVDNTRASISTTKAIGTLTVATTDGSAVNWTPAALAADAAIAFEYDLTNNAWYPA